MKVLLADDDAERGRLAALLASDPALAVTRIRAAEGLAEAVAAHAPDVVLLDLARPDRAVVERLRLLAAREPRPVVLFVAEDDPGFMEEAIAAGVCSYHVRSLPPPEMKPLLRAAAALFAQHQRTRAALEAAAARLRERVLIDRAKAALMRGRRMTEADAHRWLQRRAMQRGQRMAEVARELVRREQDEDTP